MKLLIALTSWSMLTSFAGASPSKPSPQPETIQAVSEQELAAMNKTLLDFIKRQDSNKDGSLSDEELVKINIRHCPNELTLYLIDRNQDRKISKEEINYFKSDKLAVENPLSEIWIDLNFLNKRLCYFVKKLDSNKDGELSDDELDEIDLVADDDGYTLHCVDADKNGLISRDEMMAFNLENKKFHEGLAKQEVSEVVWCDDEMDTKEMGHDLRDFIIKFDNNKDSQLSADELSKADKDEFYTQRLLFTMDKNHDRKISKQEVDEFRGRPDFNDKRVIEKYSISEIKEEIVEEEINEKLTIRKFVKKFDLNKDGIVSDDEVSKIDPNDTDASFGLMMYRRDTNKDGQVTLDEMKNARKKAAP
ncbi:MAG: hypothetical protein RL095_2306 [Verrucomicrobiota bacterium]|jgi:hypothetical protein